MYVCVWPLISISDEKKRPDLLVVKLSAVLCRLDSVEASHCCVVDAQIVVVEVSSRLKEVLAG